MNIKNTPILRDGIALGWLVLFFMCSAAWADPQIRISDFRSKVTNLSKFEKVSAIEKYDYAGVIGCSGSGLAVSILGGSIDEIVAAIISAANDPAAHCSNPGFPPNIYTFNYRDGLRTLFTNPLRHVPTNA
ncbi:hypothetical protein [Acidovorax sp.]|uniref:hypothetical protein n=1 Tax=Acidovorax sp. TaxID=1872122 RepID=UPI00391D3B7A